MPEFRANVVAYDQIDRPEGGLGAVHLNDPWIQYRVLAEGDSWFTLGGIPTSNLLFSLRFDSQALIVTAARPGDTLRNIGQIKHNRGLQDMLAPGGCKWNAIVMSGGGNDLIGGLKRILKCPREYAEAKDFINQDELDKTLGMIVAAYGRIIDLRDQGEARGRPLIIHTYDYATPRPAQSQFLGVGVTGPWLYAALSNLGIPEEFWIPIAQYLIDALAESLLTLDGQRNVHVVDTRKVLTPAELGTKAESGDWLNEIHPSSDGYKKLARKIEETLIPLLPLN